MPRIDVYDPPMCCSTGVCGPTVDPILAAFAADLQWLREQGVTVTRHNPTQEPQAFVENQAVMAILEQEGNDCLPLVLVDDHVQWRGAYPRREALARAAGLVPAASRSKPIISLQATGSCCTSDKGSC